MYGADYKSYYHFPLCADFAPTEQGDIFAQLWDMVLVLAADPYPSVVKLANIIFLHILEEVSCVSLFNCVFIKCINRCIIY